ncbi:MAG: response regulator [Chloroflexi bacterium]|nr:response regulator [Chloroflexota bacterium]
MNRPRLLVVEDDQDIATMLKMFFEHEKFQVTTVSTGREAVRKARTLMPNLILLDIILPDIDGYEVFRQIRSNPRTAHIPVIFLTQRDERYSRLQGLEMGADDYITKPFDPDELRLRIKNILKRIERERLTDPRTHFPSGRSIEEYLRRIIRRKDWSLVDIWIKHFDAFREVYGFIAADDALRFTAILITQVMDQMGKEDDFIGHPAESNFIIVTDEHRAGRIADHLKARFDEEVKTLYNYIDRERGYIVRKKEDGTEEKVPLMTLDIGILNAREHDFADIREITELAAQSHTQRRR